MTSYFLNALRVSTGAIRAQQARMNIIAQNLANAETVTSPSGEPYRRKIASFRSYFNTELGVHELQLAPTLYDTKPFQQRYYPSHPLADKKGYVSMPNINTLVEIADMRLAQHAYEANVHTISATKRLLQRTIDILK